MGVIELGGIVFFRFYIGLRFKIKLLDFRIFYSGKNNCIWGKNT